ncbi:hypothetical protein HY095_04855 [Candidatus Micrarchaeota archaeon]|nr:hypothetical protein [Candidatus Micrarchaeota archaeon]
MRGKELRIEKTRRASSRPWPKMIFTPSPPGPKRGQGATEFLLILSIVVAFVVAVAAPAAKDMELTFAVTAARSATANYAAGEGLRPTSISNAPTPEGTLISINAYPSRGAAPPNSTVERLGMQRAGAMAIAQTFGSRWDAASPNCASGVFRQYCVEVKING